MTYSSFTLDNSSHGNEVTGVMFDAMLAELRKETSKPRARVLRIQARGNVFCTGRERAGRTPAAIRRESARIIKFKARSEEHTSELQSRLHIVCRLLLEKKKEK